MYKIFLCGLDNSGKTSITNSIRKIPNPGKTMPTLSFDVAQVVLDLTEFVIFDAPGQTRFRSLWKDSMFGTQIVCYVVDVNATERYEEAKALLDKTLKDSEEEDLPLIICFHKLDMPEAKQNLEKVKEVFKEENFSGHSVHYLETTIFNPDSILTLKALFIQIIEDKM